MQRIAVIGGGYTGTAFAIQLARASPVPFEIVLAEPRDRVGGGLAHSAVDPDHRLNAPDVIHFLYPEDPMHFRGWLERSGRLRDDPEGWYADGRLYPRRGDFGAYLAAEFDAQAASNPSGSRLIHRRAAAAGLERRRDVFEVPLSDGDRLEADRCVIALGQEPAPARLPGLDVPDVQDRVVHRPLAPHALEAVDPDDAVLVLGTGLTCADAVATLVRQGHQGAITCLSRHGVRPTDQNPAKPTMPIWEQLAVDPPAYVARHGRPASLLAALRVVREDARARLARGEPWHGALDEVRDAAGEIWCALGRNEKERFLRHLKPYYDGHRFRIAPQTADILAEAEASGQLRFETGRVLDVAPDARGLRVRTRPRGDAAGRSRTFGTVVCCVGFSSRVEQSHNPLVRDALRRALVRPSDMGRGFDADGDCHALSAGGPDPRLYVLGSMTLDRFGETPAAVFILRQILRMLPAFLSAAGRPSGARRASVSPGSGARPAG